MKNFTFTKLNPRYAYVGSFSFERAMPGYNGESVGANFPTLDFSGVTTLLLPAAITWSPTITGNITITGSIINTTANNSTNAPITTHSTTAINSTAAATAAQVAVGYITSTSGSGTTITLPTGTLLGAALNAVQGTIFDLYIDNTAGSSTVTIAVATNGILSAAAAAGSSAGAGLLTVPSGVTGQACFRLMFSSATAYTFSRIA